MGALKNVIVIKTELINEQQNSNKRQESGS